MTATPDHHLAAAREQRVAVEAPTTSVLLDELSSTLAELENSLDKLGSKLGPVLIEAPTAALVSQSRPEARTALAHRLDELSSWAQRLVVDVRTMVERVEL